MVALGFEVYSECQFILMLLLMLKLMLMVLIMMSKLGYVAELWVNKIRDVWRLRVLVGWLFWCTVHSFFALIPFFPPFFLFLFPPSIFWAGHLLCFYDGVMQHDYLQMQVSDYVLQALSSMLELHAHGHLGLAVYAVNLVFK